jgi:hypothetical protein
MDTKKEDNSFFDMLVMTENEVTVVIATRTEANNLLMKSCLRHASWLMWVKCQGCARRHCMQIQSVLHHYLMGGK